MQQSISGSNHFQILLVSGFVIYAELVVVYYF